MSDSFFYVLRNLLCGGYCFIQASDGCKKDDSHGAALSMDLLDGVHCEGFTHVKDIWLQLKAHVT